MTCHDAKPHKQQDTSQQHAISIALAGNPNCGKTTLFNNLTGTRQRVGNWPGVTVDRIEGRYGDPQGQINIVDLPGVYTLGTLPGITLESPGNSHGESHGESLDETVARNYIISGEVDVLVNVVNAANLERNLYLTAQLIEMNLPMVIVLNMMDTARQAGLKIDTQALSQKLDVPVIAMSAVSEKNTKNNTGRLIEAIRTVAQSGKISTAQPAYVAPLQKLIDEVRQNLAVIDPAPDARKIDFNWLALRLIEGDDLACTLINHSLSDQSLIDPSQASLSVGCPLVGGPLMGDPLVGAPLVGDLSYCEQFRQKIKLVETDCGEDADILIADGRFSFANEAANAAVTKVFEITRSTSDAIDQLVLNRFAGPVIFLAAIYLMFMFTINLGGAFIDFFDQAAGAIFVDGLRHVCLSIGLPEWLAVLFADGLGGGVQVVATFIPIMGFLYLFLSFLEDSGYMARAAFLMDRFMRLIGLPGKAFVPLIVGFGCNVPAIMASRTLEQQNDRILTTMMSPFMSCGARLTIYALFTAAFFPSGGSNIVFALYLIGIAAALATGFLLKKTILHGEITPFIMELPPYRMPTLKNLLFHTWLRVKGFVFGAGKIIVLVVAILSVFNSLGTDGSFGNQDSEKSVLSEIGRTITPAFAPIGLKKDNWPAAVGLFTGVFAKEAVVGTLNSLYSPATASDDDQGLQLGKKLYDALATIPENLSNLGQFITDPLGLTVLESAGDLKDKAAAHDVSTGTFGEMVRHFDGKIGAFAYLLFILLYFPCLAALSAVAAEAGRKWAAFAGLWSTGLAYFVAVVFYQTATFTRHPQSSLMWLAGAAIAMAGFVILLKQRAKHDQTARAKMFPAE